MRLFNIFKKKSTEEMFREKIRNAFENSVRDTKKHLNGDMLFDGLMVQAAIGNMRKALLEAPEIQILGLSQNWSPEKIIDEECQRVMSKYLE